MLAATNSGLTLTRLRYFQPSNPTGKEPPTMTRTIRLQSIGLVEAIEARDLQVGMRLVWNFGYTYDVISLKPKGTKSIEITERNTRTGIDYIRTMRLTRPVAAFWPTIKREPKIKL